ncbi:MAG: glycosyltransferase family 4 protein [Candidatus Levybacteria bacterium]|nr:glycosyltransferase family 4 protein [Candidatus Levybacteria bacterium]
MKIAQIAPIIESVPPEKYGGTERVISTLTEELVKRGHEVTLFASGDSKTSARLLSIYHSSLRKANIENMYGHNIWSLLNVGLAYQLQDEFDIIHDHNSQNNPVSLPLANIAKVPVVMTLHGALTNGYNKAFEFYRKPYLVTVSKKQAEPAPNLHYIGNVYHGINMHSYPFYQENDGYLLFVGRVRVEHGVEVKGLHHAIDIAETTNMPLIIAAKIDTSFEEDVRYFNQVIKPRLSSKIRWIGEVDETTRNTLMSRAFCTLHTINFAEPFGLTLIEAMACGSPVIGFDRGSIPEIIQHGKTGFVVKNTYEAINALKNIGTIDRLCCRSYVKENFSAEKMAEAYEKIYYKVAKKTIFKRIPKTIMQSSTANIHSIRKTITKVFADL